MHDLTADIERLRAEPVRDPAGLRLDGRAAFITGCDQGIGRGVMRGFLARGAQVAAGVHDPANIPAVAPALGVAVDVRDGATLHRAAAAAAQRFGRIDTVVCNAGIYPRCDAAAMDEATWRGVVDVNLDGAFRTIGEQPFGPVLLVLMGLGIAAVQEPRWSILATASGTVARGPGHTAGAGCTRAGDPAVGQRRHDLAVRRQPQRRVQPAPQPGAASARGGARHRGPARCLER